ADGASDPEEKREYAQQAQAAGGDADDANGQLAAARSTIETATSDRDRAASDAISRIEDITSGDDLNDGWWDDWGSKVVAAIADIADMVSMVAGLLAVVVAFIPVVGTALAGVLIVVAAVAAIVSALANVTLAATGERSWAEAGIAIAGAALSVIGLGGAAKAATGLSKAAVKQGMKSGAKKAWCKVGFGTCFTAGTLIRTPDGPDGATPIEDIRAGDKVWAHNLATGADELQTVAETFVRTTTTLHHLTIGGHVVTTTDEHPFMVQNMGWILARDLQPGDLLLTPDTGDGTGTVTLDSIHIEQRDPDATDGPVTVYNFHVETHHNYYVLAGTLPVLVHNSGAHSAAGAAKLAKNLKTAEMANPVVDSLRTTGKLPPEYLTKADAIAAGWKPGKALGNHKPGGQLGGDKFDDPASIGLPVKDGRSWHEADIGLRNDMTRAKQPGTRLLYSDDGLAYVTPDHYESVYELPRWKQ
ncbi:polymorphic toxin-type HINT domain-containing protein, partial [Isoptericola cucumis]